MGRRLFFTGMAGESSPMMEIEIYVGNLSRSTTQEELKVLFSRAGDVRFIDLVKDRKSGDSNGYAFITMSAQSEADQAVSMFNAYSLNDHSLRVLLIRPRQQRGFDGS